VSRAMRQCPACSAEFAGAPPVRGARHGVCPECGEVLPRGPGRSVMSAEMRRGKISRLLTRDGGHCWLCEGWLGDDITLDHVVPRAKGGTNQDSNLRLAHGRCNAERGDGDAALVADGKWRIVCVGKWGAL
jgi:hypothetical protein